LCGCVTIQAKMPTTNANDTDAEARMADQFIRHGSAEGGPSNQGVEQEYEGGNGGGVEGTACILQKKPGPPGGPGNGNVGR
jgi:hypothetical protein